MPSNFIPVNFNLSNVSEKCTELFLVSRNAPEKCAVLLDAQKCFISQLELLEVRRQQEEEERKRQPPTPEPSPKVAEDADSQQQW